MQAIFLGFNSLLFLLSLGVLLLSLTFFVEIVASVIASNANPFNQFQHSIQTSINTKQLDPQTNSKTNSKTWDNLRIAILIPAHNEAAGLGSTLNSVLKALKPDDRVVVIADNCTDTTAEVARKLGVEAIERQNSEQRGKGYALDYGIAFLKKNSPPDVVIMVDADCEVHAGTIAQITELAIAKNRPVQAVYLLNQSENPTPKDLISAFAFKVKNLVRSSGLAYLNLPCLLAGTGMAFPWPVLRSINLASGNIVEDMKLGLDLAIVGYPPIFCPTAYVTGDFPNRIEASERQRTRWEHGHLQILLTYVPLLLKNAIQQRRVDLLAIALDLAIPPLSSFVLIWILITIVSILSYWFSGFWIATSLLCSSGIVMIMAIFLAWYKFGRSDIPFHKLFAIPFYIVWKIPMYLKFFKQPQTQWIRTERNNPNSSKLE